jgi:hypothetical protein
LVDGPLNHGADRLSVVESFDVGNEPRFVEVPVVGFCTWVPLSRTRHTTQWIKFKRTILLFLCQSGTLCFPGSDGHALGVLWFS